MDKTNKQIKNNVNACNARLVSSETTSFKCIETTPIQKQTFILEPNLISNLKFILVILLNPTLYIN